MAIVSILEIETRIRYIHCRLDRIVWTGWLRLERERERERVKKIEVAAARNRQHVTFPTTGKTKLDSSSSSSNKKGRNLREENNSNTIDEMRPKG
jgi:hypothetical protein